MESAIGSAIDVWALSGPQVCILHMLESLRHNAAQI